METKMKKIPFDLERAKKGEAFRMSKDDRSDNYHVLSNDEIITFKYNMGSDLFYTTLEIATDLKEAYHLIPDEPKAERWAVVQKKRIYNSEKIAEMDCQEYNDRQNRYDAIATNEIDKYTVVKLADEQ